MYNGVLQENEDELKGACGFTPHPHLKVCPSRTDVCGKLRCVCGIINTVILGSRRDG